MCLALLAIDALPDTPLLVLGNRDEFHARPSVSAAPWRVLRTTHDYAPFHLLLGQGADIKMRFLERTAGSFWLAISAQSLSPRRRGLARHPRENGG